MASARVQGLSNPSKKFPISAALARRLPSGYLGSCERLGVFSRLSHQGPELLRLLSRILGEPLPQSLIVFNQALAPSLTFMQGQRFFGTAAVLDL